MPADRRPDTPPADAPDDDSRRRFREALDQKRRAAGNGGGTPHDPGTSVTPQVNTKRQRTFRRKSG